MTNKQTSKFLRIKNARLIGEAGAKNAGLFAASILALEDKSIAQQLEKFRSAQTEKVLKGSDPRI